MPNISDQELDKLFQEAGQGVRPEFDPNDWEDLAKRLDREERKGIAWRAGGYGLAVLLLISSAAWLTESGATTRPRLAIQQTETGNNTKQRSLSTDTTKTLSLPKTQTPPTTANTAATPATTTPANAAAAQTSAAANGESASTPKKQTGNAVEQSNAKESAAMAGKQQAATTRTQNVPLTADNGQSDAATQKAQGATADKGTATKALPGKQAAVASSTVATSRNSAAQHNGAAQTSGNNNLADNRAVTGSKVTNQNTQTMPTQAKASGTEKNAASNSVYSKGVPATIQQRTVQQPAGTSNAANTQQNEKSATALTQTGTAPSLTGNTGSTAAASQQTGSAVNQKSKKVYTSTQSITGQEQNNNGSDEAATAGKASNDSLAPAPAGNKPVASATGNQAGRNVAAATAQQPGNALTGNGGQQEKSAEENGAANRTDGDLQKNANGTDTVTTANNRGAMRPTGQNGTVKNTGALVVEKTAPHDAGNKALAPNSEGQPASENSNGTLRANTAQAQNTTDKNAASSNAEQPVEGNNAGVLTANPALSQNATGKESVQNEASQPANSKTDRAAHPADSVAPPKDSVALADTKAAADTTSDDSAEEKKKEKTPAKWFIKLPVSPDFSSIDYGKPGKSGINIGLMAEYMPSRHWSVSLGAIWSKKIYSWDNPDKTYGGNNWSVKASYLDGDCRVLDIPLNITYYLRPEARTNFFITAGVSSYIMLKEMYTYTVWANQQEYQYDEKYVRKNNNLFSMLNLSIGVQHRLSNRFQVQAEPFLKAPISGVGQGKVNLVSMGAFFTLKYQLNK